MKRLIIVAMLALAPSAAMAQRSYIDMEGNIHLPGDDVPIARVPNAQQPFQSPTYDPPKIMEIRPNGMNAGSAGNAGSSFDQVPGQRVLTCTSNPYIPTQCQ